MQVTKWIRRGCIAVLALALLVTTVALLPISAWRTGEIPATPLVARQADSDDMPSVVWIDSDPACGLGGRHDPDDCWAILRLLLSADIEIAGVSTVFGNTDLAETDRVARQLVRVASAQGLRSPSVHQGSGYPLSHTASGPTNAAVFELRAALSRGPMTILALGPLTNIAAALHERCDLQANVTSIVAVMGRRPGHVFHPSEGAGHGALFGHGPVFRDLNLVLDPDAASRLIGMQVPLVLVPYELASGMALGERELVDLHEVGPAGAWVAEGSREWLEFWKNTIGIDGFYPFDLMAAEYIVAPDQFRCADAVAAVGRDPAMLPWWPLGRVSLIVEPTPETLPRENSWSSVVYCMSYDRDPSQVNRPGFPEVSEHERTEL